MDATVLQLGQKAITMAVVLSAPILITGLLVGLIISLFQAATQIQEMTISFVPKVLAVALVGLALGPWMLKMLVAFTQELLLGIPNIIQ